MLDTQTGRLWQYVCEARSEDGKDCTSSVLQFVPYKTDAGTYTYTPEPLQVKKPTK